MKKTFNVLKIILIAVFIGAFALLIINQMSVNEHQVVVEDTIGTDVSYYRDELYFFTDYYKYEDADGIQYWVSEATNKLDYVYNPQAEGNNTAVSQSKAEDIAYAAAKKYNSDVFKSDTIIELKEKTYYEFYIFELDDSGYKTGRFIIVKVAGNGFEYVSMHTEADGTNPELGLCIGEGEAINSAYLASADSEFRLSAEDNHLVDTGFYKNDGKWLWEVKIYKISESEIVNQTEPVELDNYFYALIDATTGEIISYEWIYSATDYCPLDGTIF